MEENMVHQIGSHKLAALQANVYAKDELLAMVSTFTSKQKKNWDKNGIRTNQNLYHIERMGSNLTTADYMHIWGE